MDEESEDGPQSTQGDWETIKELVFQWEDEQPADLDAWLNERCPTAAIRQETERLVRAAALSGDFMQGRAVEDHFGIAPQHPVHVGRYRIIEELGVGGLGVVYSAYDHALERKVAIKVLLRESAAEPESRRRLRWDAKAACATEHPNIVVIHDFGTDGGRDYIVMECIEGQSLGKLIPKDGLPCQTVLHYALQIASGLEAAHRGGIVHRDLKPNNIMVTEEGVVKLLDFGLARNYDPSAEYSSLPATIEGHFAGTVAYVSPEQAEGKPVDARGDIFSFGCILFEMLTGKQAFQGRNAVSILGNVMHQPAPRLRQVAPHLDERFETIVERCLSKKPDDRFPTIGDVKARLGELVESGEPSPRLSQRARKRLIRWGAGAGIAALVALGVLWIATRQPFPGTERFYAAQLTAGEGLSSFPAISRDGSTVAYASDRAGNGDLDIWMQYWGLADAHRLTSNPANETSPVFYPRGDRLLYRSEQDGGGLYSISALGGTGTLLARGGRDGRFSADGRWLAYWKGDFGGAFHREQSRIYVMPARGGEQNEFLPGFYAAAHPVWSSAGNYLIFLGREGANDEPDWWVAGFESGVAHPTGLLKKFMKMGVAHPFQTYFMSPAQWLPDKTVLFSANSSKMTDVTNIWAVRVGTDGSVLDEPKQWTGGTGIEDYPSVVVTDGAVRTVFATLTAITGIWRIPLSPDGRTGGPEERLMSGFAGAGSPSVSADGRTLLFSARQPSGLNTRLADLGSPPHTIPPVVENAHAAYQPVLSGDGSTIAWEAGSTGLVMAVQGAAPEAICRPCGPPTHLTFDGRAVLFERAGEVGTPGDLLLAVRGQEPRPLFHTPDGPPWRQTSGRFSPNQHWVAFSGWHDGSTAHQILIVPVTADGLVRAGQILEVTNDEFINRQPTWSPDGRRIYFLSNRDGFGCVWARDVDPVTARPLGAEFPVAHFHSAARAIHGPSPYPGSIGLSAARDFLVLTLTETTGSIWERSTTPLL